MSIQGVGNQAVLTQLQSNMSLRRGMNTHALANDHDGDRDHGAVDRNDGGAKGGHINVKA
jgi:hypothetical protein